MGQGQSSVGPDGHSERQTRPARLPFEMAHQNQSSVGPDGHHSANRQTARPAPGRRLSFEKGQVQTSVGPNGPFGFGSRDNDRPLIDMYKDEREKKKQTGLEAFQTDTCTIYTLLALLFSRTMITSLLEGNENDSYGINNLFREGSCLTKCATNVGIVVKSFIVLVLCILSGTLQLLPIFLVGWYQPGDIEKGYLARVVKGDEEKEKQAYFWMVYFGLPYFMLFLKGGARFFVTLRNAKAVWECLPTATEDGVVLTAVRDLLLMLAVSIKAITLFGVMLLAYATLTADQAITTVATFPPVITILTNVVGLDYLLCLDVDLCEHLVKAKLVGEISTAIRKAVGLHSYDNESEEERKKLAWYIRGFLSLKKLSMKLANFSMWLVAVCLPIFIIVATVILTLSTWASECRPGTYCNLENQDREACRAVFMAPDEGWRNCTTGP